MSSDTYPDVAGLTSFYSTQYVGSFDPYPNE